MRRLFDNRVLNRNEYAIIGFCDTAGESYFGIALWDTNDNRPFLFSDKLCGSTASLLSKIGTRYSWVLPHNNQLPIAELVAQSHGDTIEDYRDFFVYTGGIEGIFSSTTLDWLRNTVQSEGSSTIEDGAVLLSDSTTSTTPSRWYSDNYTHDYWYHGQHSYHHSHCTVFNRPLKRYKHLMGIELEVEFEEEDDRNDFVEMDSNWFQRENDGSLEEYGCEIVTIPLLPEDAKSVDFWRPLCTCLSRTARSWDTGRCGLHVHIGREILGTTDEQKSETLGRLLYVYHHCIKDTRLNCKIYGRERGYSDADAKTDISKAAATLGADVLGIKAVRDKVKDSMLCRSRDTRYFDINLQNSKTIEFRRGKGSLNPERIAMVAEYCERLCIYAKNTPWPQIGYTDLCNFLKATASPKLKEMVEQWG